MKPKNPVKWQGIIFLINGGKHFEYIKSSYFSSRKRNKNEV